MRADPSSLAVRARLAELADRRDVTLAGLSRMIGRADGYLARYVIGGPPARLVDRDRALLAAFFGVSERELDDGATSSSRA